MQRSKHGGWFASTGKNIFLPVDLQLSALIQTHMASVCDPLDSGVTSVAPPPRAAELSSRLKGSIPWTPAEGWGCSVWAALWVFGTHPACLMPQTEQLSSSLPEEELGASLSVYLLWLFLKPTFLLLLSPLTYSQWICWLDVILRWFLVKGVFNVQKIAASTNIWSSVAVWDKSCCSSGSCSWTLTLFCPFSSWSSFMTHENIIPSHWGTSPTIPQGSGRGNMHSYLHNCHH